MTRRGVKLLASLFYAFLFWGVKYLITAYFLVRPQSDNKFKENCSCHKSLWEQRTCFMWIIYKRILVHYSLKEYIMNQSQTMVTASVVAGDLWFWQLSKGEHRETIHVSKQSKVKAKLLFTLNTLKRLRLAEQAQTETVNVTPANNNPLWSQWPSPDTS